VSAIDLFFILKISVGKKAEKFIFYIGDAFLLEFRVQSTLTKMELAGKSFL